MIHVFRPLNLHLSSPFHVCSFFFPTRAIAAEFFGFAIHWYGVMYLLAFIMALILLPKLQRERGLNLSREQWASVVSYAVFGVIVGGRLGYVLFYEPRYFSIRPTEIIAVWNGGMSSHGGFVGVALALFCIASGISSMSVRLRIPSLFLSRSALPSGGSGISSIRNSMAP